MRCKKCSKWMSLTNHVEAPGIFYWLYDCKCGNQDIVKQKKHSPGQVCPTTVGDASTIARGFYLLDECGHDTGGLKMKCTKCSRWMSFTGHTKKHGIHHWFYNCKCGNQEILKQKKEAADV